MQIKTFLVVLFSLFFNVVCGQAFYYESISTPDKSIDFLFGFYVHNLEIEERKDGSMYTIAQIGLINKSQKSFDWNDYKVYVLLKNGDLFYNYKTEAKSGDYTCVFTLQGGETLKKKICFEKNSLQKTLTRFGCLSMITNFSNCYILINKQLKANIVKPSTLGAFA